MYRGTLNTLICFLFFSTSIKSQTISCQNSKIYQVPIYNSLENLRSDTFDILKYKINLEIGNTTNQQISGNTQIIFAPKINNRLFIRFDLLKLIVDSIKENNSTLSYNYNDTVLKINFISLKNITDTSMITIYYHGHPQIDATNWGGFYFWFGVCGKVEFFTNGCVASVVQVMAANLDSCWCWPTGLACWRPADHDKTTWVLGLDR
jgi:hypothetical protein